MYSTILIKSVHDLTYLELTEVTEDLLLSLLLLPPYPPPPPPPPPPLRPPSPLAIMVSPRFHRRRRPSPEKKYFLLLPRSQFPNQTRAPENEKVNYSAEAPFFPRNRSRPPRLQKEMTCPIIFLGPREGRVRDKDLFSRSSVSNPRFIRALCIPGKRGLLFKMQHRRLRLTAAKLQIQAFIEKV